VTKTALKPVWWRKDLLGMEDLSREEISLILDTAESFKEVSSRTIKKVPALRGKTIVNLFFEPSTRTRASFELAEKRLSGDVLNLSSSASSVVKGETLLDTLANIEAMNVDVVVVRHSAAGAAHLLAANSRASVLNAGDGAHEHPTQSLLDLYTVREKLGRLDNIKIAMIGDIAHSRVARSNIWGFTKFGAEVTVCGPTTLLPPHMEKMGATVTHRLEDALADADVIYALRIQHERQRSGLLPTLREYIRMFSVNRTTVQYAPPHALVMHPGPMNRNVELESEVADGPNNVILDQVTNGVAVRMAALYLVGNRESDGGSTT
jgi:aspartate carbamoyltransferase catalytic subunit